MFERHFALLLPVFNDWRAFEGVLALLDRIACDQKIGMSVFAVNDGSTVKVPENLGTIARGKNIEALEIINLVCNMGNQRAIAIGLCEIAKREGFDAIIVMDSDGEDDPGDIPALLKAFDGNPESIILAQRKTRSEGITFKIAYSLYKQLFRILTGRKITFGNYCLLPFKWGKRLTYKSSLWNSLPATVLLSKLPYVMVPTNRAKRLDGHSHMNFISLVIFGLHAITVFSDAVMVRLALMVGAGVSLVAVSVIVLRFMTNLYVPGWASSVILSLTVIGLQVLFLLLNASLLVLNSRSLMPMVPATQYTLYIENIIKAIRAAPSGTAAVETTRADVAI